jgi:hypothetical protein
MYLPNQELKGIPPKIVQHRIELDTTIPPIYQIGYKLNFNYVAIIKQDINKLLLVLSSQLRKQFGYLK